AVNERVDGQPDDDAVVSGGGDGHPVGGHARAQQQAAARDEVPPIDGDQRRAGVAGSSPAVAVGGHLIGGGRERGGGQDNRLGAALGVYVEGDGVVAGGVVGVDDGLTQRADAGVVGVDDDERAEGLRELARLLRHHVRHRGRDEGAGGQFRRAG